MVRITLRQKKEIETLKQWLQGEIETLELRRKELEEEVAHLTSHAGTR
jgi:peptidoglycan hydrolase CwlO-like protein